MASSDTIVIQLAREKGLLNDAQVAVARARLADDAHGARAQGLVERLIADGQISEDAVQRLLAEEFSLPRVDLAAIRPTPEALASVPRDFVVRHAVLPFERRGRVLRLAIGDPQAFDTIDGLAQMLQLAIEPALAPARDVAEAIERHYARDPSDWTGIFGSSGPGRPPDGTRRPAIDPAGSGSAAGTHGTDGPVIRLVQRIILESLQRRASDIHLEPLAARLRVRNRIDGSLLEIESLPKRLQPAIVSRVKLMADLSIAEKRLPQDGRIQIEAPGRSVDLRVSCLPTVHGESIVLRLLDRERVALGFSELGLLADDQCTCERLLALPDGLLLVTGPTGSGKTTTLYACLHHLNRPDRKIVTVEDPVEYQLAGINQVPVREEVGLTFAAALRALLRQSPDIVMVGEIRDLETAEIAVNASLTGHLVFSTLHTNDAPGAITRLLDLGVKPFLVASALRATLAQRLVRRICRACQSSCPPGRQPHPAGPLLAGPAGWTGLEPRRCGECHGTGYRGCLGIFEIFVVTEEIRRMIYDNVSVAKLRDAAHQNGMRTMRDDGFRKALAGLTTREEVMTVAVDDARREALGSTPYPRSP